MAGCVQMLKNGDEATAFRKANGQRALLFVQAAHGPSQQMQEVFENFQEDFPTVAFGVVDVASNKCFAHANGVTEVPTTIFYEDGELLGRLVGALPAVVAKALTAWTNAGRSTLVSSLRDLQPSHQPPSKDTAVSLEERLSSLVNSHPVMVFMKGKREAPFCRFSKQLMGIFAEKRLVHFGAFDVFDDEEVREGLKKFSNWPTYPQVYVKGELIGGVDIIRALCEDGSFNEVFPPEAFA
ncbi:glutaredoxin domain-containing protein [Toxoplasma gondii ME49]|uniref:Glutaredoxin domain-containing protein n=14 Tax=Toxoplasma gondii TaxID=5811 RepID=B9PNS0_TOXGV|nr:glutaredoxin domain-containing protein [Toxoplasma gondii ME49]EPR60390.1 glutaredoxin domain-containing protein [Toxoplasma gondii GT1]ESS31296.1 glutaredoxin domain-containing protein [Toxoplasma gondii VEG]KAF4643574.1 glutaredoxin domain-containing protein [Toxoplasma gondii]KFG29804.1 glutaredoxin domain-containing protein [Toxoplasma gondii GAB2-2007-GAL-DOM2]KFG34079.1 glutaredoxin domain-containing protein [Toxoplasma gondii FOU]KFG39427.1 glutaredoxin domain-containing protein [To|eukprot:XP_002366499.1 glutaredoxin domain-containing protein [Toxoplasma gondii ME49]